MTIATLALSALAVATAQQPPQPAAPPASGQPGLPATLPPAAGTPVAVSAPEGAQFIPLETSEQGALDEQRQQEDLISITLDDVPLVDVIRMFTRISGANIIATPSELVGTVTVNLQDVQWRPALTAILEMHGFTIVEKQPGSGVFSVVSRPKDAPPPLTTRTFKLKFVTTSDVTPIIEKMLTQGGSISPFPSRNVVIVQATAEDITKIAEIIEAIDQPSRQICIETKFMELNDEASKQLGIRWDSLESFGARIGAGPFTTAEERTRDIARTDSSSRSDTRTYDDNVTKFYDKNNLQFEESTVEFKPLFPEASNPDEFFAEFTITPTRTVEDKIGLARNNARQISDAFNKTVRETKAAILELDSFEMVLSALKRTDGVSVISNPKLLVANGSTNAFFSVGEREPIIKTEVTRGTQESPGDKVTAELDTSINTDYIKEGYLETGIDLRVVPVLKTDDLIEAQITPSLKRKIASKTIEGNSWPVISVKEIQTRFTLRSGQTVAIGGLTDTGDEKRVSKVPLLGDIPLIGKYLFTHTEDVKRQIETIIFVTLSVADPELLIRQTGIPEDSELVHKRLLQNEQRREQFKADMRLLQQAADAARQEETQKTRAHHLKRRR
jgi:type II secretory pathway component GspD/PulD (secretin)